MTSPPKKLDLALIAQRMEGRGLSAADLARHCDVSRETVSGWLQGEFLPRPRHGLRLCMLLGLTYHQLHGLPDPATLPPREVCIQVGLPWRVSKDYAERALDDACQLHTLDKFLPASSPFVRALVQEPSLSAAHLAAVAASVRAQLGYAADQALNASVFVALLRQLGAHLSPSVRYAKDTERWTQVVYLQGGAERLFVYLPAEATLAVRLRGLAEAYGVCLAVHKLPPADARRYGKELAKRLLSAASVDDTADWLDVRSPRRLVDSARRIGMGDLFDAVQAVQVREGGRDHAFASQVLRVYLPDAYALTAELSPVLRARLEAEEARAEHGSAVPVAG